MINSDLMKITYVQRIVDFENTGSNNAIRFNFPQLQRLHTFHVKLSSDVTTNSHDFGS